MENRRIYQLAIMLSDITGVERQAAEQIIVKTETGKAILKNNESILYEQQTENLYRIALELEKTEKYADMAKKLTEENIIKSMRQLWEMEIEARKQESERYVRSAVPEKKREDLLEKQRKMLKIKRQNYRNVRRMKNAD